MAKMTLRKWKQIGSICGYDGTKTASVWSEDADRLRKACPYGVWKKMAGMFDMFKKKDSPSDVQMNVINSMLARVLTMMEDINSTTEGTLSEDAQDPSDALVGLWDMGTITDDEYELMKDRISTVGDDWESLSNSRN